MSNRLVKKIWAKALPWFIAFGILLAMSLSLNIVMATYLVHIASI